MRPPRPLHVALAWSAVILVVYLAVSVPSGAETASVAVRFCPGDCEGFLLSVLQNSSEMACAFYDLGLQPVINVLRHKESDVLVFDENHQDYGEPVRSEGLMHHKFCVLDGRKVVTGSTNPTLNGVRKNDNNLLLIVSDTVAGWYLDELQDLGGRKDARGGTVQLENGSLAVLFCPQQDCESAVLRELQSARHSIRFMTFSFTADAIGGALLDAHARNVTVQGVFEARMNPRYSEYERLLEWGIDVRKDSNPSTMHHKVFIIDNRTVITGSYNPTWSGTHRNDENLLIIHDERIARAFLEEFERIW